MTDLQLFGIITFSHLMLIVAIILFLTNNNMLTKKQSHKLVYICIVQIVAVIYEFVFEFLYLQRLVSPQAIAYLYPATQIFFSIQLFLVANLMATKKKTIYLTGIIPALEVVLVAISFWFWGGATVSEEYEISAGPMLYVITALNIAFFIVQQVMVITVNKKRQNTSYFIYGLMSLVLLTGRVLQLYFKEVKVFFLSFTLTVLLYIIFLANRTKEYDEITKLLNRDAFTVNLRHIQKDSIIMVYDIDFFKVVNDDNGHEYGDHVLEKIGEIFLKVYSSSGKCYRIGGDEFSIIITKNKEFLKSMIQRIDDMVEKERKIDPNFPTVSFGMAVVENDRFGEETFYIADKNMYEFKEKRKAQMTAQTQEIEVKING